MMCQGVSTAYVASFAKEGRSSAVGLYVTSFYVGGSVGALLPGLTWTSWGWPGAVAMTLGMIALMGLVVGLAWRETPAGRT
jgi:predicted MFS family arabinose efflux permease